MKRNSIEFVFAESIDDDIWNWQEVATSKRQYGKNWMVDWPKALNPKETQDKRKLKLYLKCKYYKKEAIKKYSDWLNAAFDSSWIVEPLEKMIGKKFPFKKVRAVITTANRCPYDPKERMFFVHYGAGLSWIVVTSLHECMHFLFINITGKNFKFWSFRKTST